MAAGKKVSKTLVWILMGLLFLGLVGFGATGLQGTARTIGHVGDKPLDVQTYINNLQSGLNRLQQSTGQRITFREAQELGLSRSALYRRLKRHGLHA